MSGTTSRIASLLGLGGPVRFGKDPVFLAGLLAGLIYGLWAGNPGQITLAWPFFLTVFIKPLYEEIFFRGILQGWLSEKPWGRGEWRFGISVANLVASLAFMVLHAVERPLNEAWIFFFPSLLFGLLRDRNGNIYPAFVLHAVFNAGFLLARSTA